MLLATTVLQAQNLPNEWQLLTDEHQLKIGKTTEDGFYNVNEIKTIYLTFEDPNWQSVLDANYNTENYLSGNIEVDGLLLENIGVQYKGQTSYNMLPPGSEKKSFSFKTDEFVLDQELFGYNNINLNNAFQDATFLREFLYVQSIRKFIPAAKASFVKLIINGESWGLYVNVQQLNKDYLEEWFLSNDGTNWRADSPNPEPGPPNWGDGTTALNYLGADAADYQEKYTLKSTEEADPWALLINTCDVLNNTPLGGLVDALPEVMDVDRALWFLACEIAFADDDSYIYKGRMDYYVHWEKETGRLVPLEFDGNSVLTGQTQNWSPFYRADNANFPLMYRLMQIPEYRQRYLAHLRTVVDESLSLATTQALISQYSDFIDAEVQADTKKIYTYNQFLSGLNILQNIINTRRNTINNYVEVNVASPVIGNAILIGENGLWTVNPGEIPEVQVESTAPDGVASVWLYYSDAWVGNFEKIEMTNSGGNVYSAELPALSIGGVMRFYFESIRQNAAATRSYLPTGAEHDVFFYSIEPQWVESDVVINEIMALNNSTATDEAGQYEDWIELYNNGNETINLSGYYLSDKTTDYTKWEIPAETTIEPDEYLIVWADEDATDGILHSNFKLSGTGETLTLLTPNFEIADQVVFGELEIDMGFARVPNGTGGFMVQEPTFAANNNAVTAVFHLTKETPLVFPNPTADFLNVRLHQTLADNQLWNIVDLSGRVVLTGNTTSTGRDFQIDVNSIPEGLYLLRLQTTDNWTMAKFAVTR
jgi:hypothetical protein